MHRLMVLAAVCAFLSRAAAENGPGLLPVAEAAARVRVPPGFKVSLFAGEPDVCQPIAMCFDDRGRLWVAECYTYSDATTNFDLSLHDRIVIFEDSTASGHFDKRKVFWDQGQRLTSIAVGFGGVFATCAPNLIFIPDRNGDDVPDGPPEILLDGWNDNFVRHNIVNGLKWGPDGWLYGRHGILATSAVGKPGTPASARTELNCAIWRYHPTRGLFEVVCQGGTNPWGHDWDRFGELFFINTVIGHLWEGIPGAYYQRMYGEHLAPYRYGLIEQAADHYHWDTGKTWQESGRGGSLTDSLGGGHAHSGLMIYQGGTWPVEFEGRVFAVNYHGRRLNRDRLDRFGSGLVGRHEPDFAQFGDPWFRGIDLDYGPDGDVYVLDWSDTGECHENDADGVHRDTGRIYKISYTGDKQSGAAKALAPDPRSLLTNSLANWSDTQLLQLQSHPNEWFVRHARRILQERHLQGRDSARVTAQALDAYRAESDPVRRFRLMLTLHALGQDSESWLKEQLKDPDDHLRAWAVRLLGEPERQPDWAGRLPLLKSLALDDPSPTVRLALASALQRVPVDQREDVAAALLRHGEDVSDHNLPLMLWYALEPLAAQQPGRAIRLALGSQNPLVRRYIARRVAEGLGTDARPVEALLEAAAQAPAAEQIDFLGGLAEALRGWRKAPKPRAWDRLSAALAESSEPELQKLARELGVVFGDGRALDELRRLALQADADPVSRRNALEQLSEAQPTGLETLLEKLLTDRVTVGVAARGLLHFEDPTIPARVLQQWDYMLPQDRAAVAGLLASRPASSEVLLDAVGRGQIPRSALTAFEARQIGNYNREGLTRKLTAVWGEVRTSADDKRQLMARYRSVLTSDRLKGADLSHGRALFTRVCAVCHKLYGEGAAIGPDLTGSGRANLDYLLENIVDPSAIVPADYRVSEVELKDSRELTALIVARTERTLTLQTPTERMVVDRGEISKIRETSLSLMPDGLLLGLKDAEIRDLVGYLMSPTQVQLPAGAAAAN